MSTGEVKQKVRTVVDIVSALETLSSEVESLWMPRKIPKLSSEPSPIEFLREYVSRSVPCIIPYDQSACVGLTLDDLVDLSGENCEVTVDVTPDGHGDCVRPVLDKCMTVNMFIQPEERVMSLAEFRSKLRQSRATSVHTKCPNAGKTHLIDITLETSGDEVNKTGERLKNEGSNINATASEPPVYYYSKQNDCLRTELQNIFDNSVLFPRTIPFAEEAFGTSLEAVNLWVGDERAVSSMHKDHYENLFLVLSGEKIFTLCPPSDMAFLYEKEFDSARLYCKDNHEWVARMNNFDPIDNEGREKPAAQRVKWIEPDVTEPDQFSDKKRFPLLHNAHPVEVRVKEGEMLYLPSLWFHRVTQSCETVGINYWFDMRFDDPKWCYFHFLQSISSGESENNC